MKVRYPKSLKIGDTIGVTAPSSGAQEPLHILVSKAKENVEARGYRVVTGKTAWTQHKGKSASKEKRAEELMSFLLDENITAIIPPWGGSFAMEILPLMDWEKLKSAPPKWLLGYSDISTFLFAYSTITGNASAHGINFAELSSPQWDPTSSRWTDVLGCSENGEVTQYSSDHYQSNWQKVYDNPATGFYFDSNTEWKNLSKLSEAEFSGRLLGGCISTLRVLIGTQFDQVNDYVSKYASADGIVWYFDSVGLDAINIYRSLWQMKQAGWFNHTNGILIGRLSRYSANQDFGLEDALSDIFTEHHIPVIYDVDIGHSPPQNILVNGAFAKITYKNTKGTIHMKYQ